MLEYAPREMESKKSYLCKPLNSQWKKQEFIVTWKFAYNLDPSWFGGAELANIRTLKIGACVVSYRTKHRHSINVLASSSWTNWRKLDGTLTFGCRWNNCNPGNCIVSGTTYFATNDGFAYTNLLNVMQKCKYKTSLCWATKTVL